MTDDDGPEVTREGFLQRIAGEVEETTGELIGNEHLAEEGRRKQADAEAGDSGAGAPAAPTDT